MTNYTNLSMKCFIWVRPLPPIFPMSKVVHYHICLQTGEIGQLCGYLQNKKKKSQEYSKCDITGKVCA